MTENNDRQEPKESLPLTEEDAMKEILKAQQEAAHRRYSPWWTRYKSDRYW